MSSAALAATGSPVGTYYMPHIDLKDGTYIPERIQTFFPDGRYESDRIVEGRREVEMRRYRVVGDVLILDAGAFAADCVHALTGTHPQSDLQRFRFWRSGRGLDITDLTDGSSETLVPATPAQVRKVDAVPKCLPPTR